MAQEKQRPPLGKTASKGQRGQQKGKPPAPPLDLEADAEQSKRQQTEGAKKPKSVGQPGGPNVRSMDHSQTREKKSASPQPPSLPLKVEGSEEGENDAHERRRAAPARRRFAANDDVPSIGGLIFALQQKPSNRPFVIAGIASGVWVALSAAMIWTVFSSVFQDISSLVDVFQSTAALSAVAAVAIPIALFWFLAL